MKKLQIIQMTILFIAAVLVCLDLGQAQSLKPNQRIAEASREIPATFTFSKQKVMIEVSEIEDEKVSATLRIEGLKDFAIHKQGKNFEVAYSAFMVRILHVSESTATFFVEKN